jgi:hypothetical protein
MTHLFKPAAPPLDRLVRMRHLLALLFLPLVAYGQGPEGAPARAAMDKLAWLEGDWAGPAWFQMGPRKSNVNQTEKLYRAAGGTVLVIQGIGTAADPGVPPATVMHDAFGILYWNAPTGQYRFRSFIGSGQSLETTADVSDRKLVWGFEIPGQGKTRYTITLTPAGEWFEIGERTTDGETWTKFFEMTLKKR